MTLTRNVSNEPAFVKDVETIKATQKAQTLVRLAEYGLGLGVFLSHFGRVGIKALRSGDLRWVFGPAFLVAMGLDFVLSARNAYKERQIQGYNKGITLLDVAVNFATLATITTGAVLGWLAYEVAAPIITAGLGLKSLFDFGSAIYHFAQSLKPHKNALEHAERLASRENALKSLGSGVTNALITVGFALLQFTGLARIVPFALGVAGTVLGMTTYLHKRRATENTDVLEETEMSSSATMHKGLGINNRRVVHGLETGLTNATVLTPVTSTASSYVPSQTRTSALDTAYSEEEEVTQRRGMGTR